MRWTEGYLPTPIQETEKIRTVDVFGLQVTEALHPGSESRPPHAHAAPTVSILLAGEFRESLDRHSSTFSARGGLCRAPGLVHENRYGTMGARVLHIELRAWHGDNAACVEWRRCDSIRLSLLGWALRAELWLDDRASSLARESLLDEIITEFDSNAEAPVASDSAPPWLTRAREVLDDCAFEPLTLSEVAEAVGVHRTSLSLQFHRFFGITPGAYVRDRRLLRAIRQISHGSPDLADVAVGSGFCDQSHMSRRIRQTLGTTPGRLRCGQLRARVDAPGKEAML